MNIATKTLIVSAAVALLGIGVWFASSLQRTLPPNSNSTAVSNSGNTNANGNAAANSNANTNFNTQVPEGWKLFTNESLEYSLYHPRDWTDVAVAENIVGFRPINISPEDQTWAAINVIVRDNPEILSLTDFYSQATGFENLFEVGLDSKELQVGKWKTVFFEIIPGAVADAAYVFIKDDQVFEVRMHRDQISHISGLEKIHSDMVASIR